MAKAATAAAVLTLFPYLRYTIFGVFFRCRVHALKTQVGCFNLGMFILVAAKLKRQRLLVRDFSDYNCKKTIKETPIPNNLTIPILHADSDH